MRKHRAKQKRNNSKYNLPEGVTLKDTLNNPGYNKETEMIFSDILYGEFKSTFKAIQSAKASTHPEAVQARRVATNMKKYGAANPGANKEVRAKAKKTMIEKYGVENALQNKELLKKSRNTLSVNYGVDNPMESREIRNTLKSTIMNKYGVDNVMKDPDIVAKLKRSNIEKYGVDNPSKDPKIIEKILKSHIKNQSTGSSKGELELKSYIEFLGFETKKSYIGGSDPKEIDIDVIGADICFEFNGAYWHSEVNPKITPRYHLNKTNNCKKRLIQIFDFEWCNRKSQLKSFIRSALGKNTRKVYARKCELFEVDKKQAKEFLDKYHILGKVNFKYCYGLKHNDELLSLITLNEHHRGGGELILNRFIGKEDVTVVGGLSKLTKHAVNTHGSISTWIDLRFSTGENWINNGWNVVHTLKPDYFYIDSKTSKIIPKQSRRKSKVNTPENITEHEHALSEKLFRVYDCGKIKLKKVK